jgi:hypothetical protein
MAFDDWQNGIPVAFFIVSRIREAPIKLVLQALDMHMKNIHNTWRPSSLIVDHAQAEINTLRLLSCFLIIVHQCHTLSFNFFCHIC